jgi:hypothetical protein
MEQSEIESAFAIWGQVKPKKTAHRIQSLSDFETLENAPKRNTNKKNNKKHKTPYGRQFQKLPLLFCQETISSDFNQTPFFHALVAVELRSTSSRKEGGMVGIGQSLNQPFAKCKITTILREIWQRQSNHLVRLNKRTP